MADLCAMKECAYKGGNSKLYEQKGTDLAFTKPRNSGFTNFFWLPSLPLKAYR